MIKKLLLNLLLIMGTTFLWAQTEATSKVNTSKEAWVKKYAAQFVVFKDTLVTLDSTESAEVVFDFLKSVDYKLSAILAGETTVTLQVEDGGIGAEVYAAGSKDTLGNTVAESPLNIQDNSPLSIKIITLGAGIGVPCRIVVLKKK